MKRMQTVPRTENFNRYIHGARGLFCLFVVVYHIWNSGLPRWPVPTIIETAMESLKYGVELFFAISGFVIVATLQPILSGHKTPLDFLVNRATRIFPVLWVTIIVFIPLAIMDKEPAVTDHLEPAWLFVLKLIGNLLAMGPILPVPVFYGVTWTIGYEFAFYSICFVYLAGRCYLKYDLLPLLLFIGTLLIAYNPRGLFFVSGIIVALMAQKSSRNSLPAMSPLIWLVLFLFSWNALAAPAPPFFASIFNWRIDHEWPLVIVAFGSLTFCISGIRNGIGVFCRLLDNSPMYWLGTISYSLYLWHPIVLGVFKFGMRKTGLLTFAGDYAQLVLFIIAAPVCILVGYVSHVILENQVSGWLRKAIKNGSRKLANQT